MTTPMGNNAHQVMLVTGASKGIGLETVLEALKKGYKVAATSRNSAKLQAEVAKRMEVSSDTFLPVDMQFTEESIANAVEQVQNTWGHIDVLVNNAGYAILGAFEEFSLAEIQANFDVNVFGLIQVTQQVLPLMRKQKSGRIINIASISGTITGPTQSIYSATKAAVIMLSEALADEVAEFGIQVSAVCPSGVRTDFLDNRSMKKPARSIAQYHSVSETMKGLEEFNHNQSGDPQLVGLAIVKLAQMSQMPHRLYLGRPAVAGVQHQINNVITEVNENIELSTSIDN